MKKYVKRYLALVLTFALVFAIPFAFTQEASAASKKSKKQTLYFVTKSATTSKASDGTVSKYIEKTTYNKKHLVTKNTWSEGKDGGKTAYKYNKKGYVTSVKRYNKKGKLTEKATIKCNKKGLPVTAKWYTVNGKKSTLIYSKKLYYKGKRVIKYVWYDYEAKEGGTEVIGNYEAPGNDGYEGNAKYDKKGRIIEDSWTDTDKETEDGVTITYKDTSVTKYYYKKSDTQAYKYVNTYTYTTSYSDGRPSVTTKSTSTTNLKYKKYKMSNKAANKYFALENVNWYASTRW